MAEAKILSLLLVVVAASGCTSIVSGSSPSSQQHGTITVNSFDVSPTTIYSGGSVDVSVELENTGGVPAELKLGERGGRVLKDYCPYIFENSRYSSTPAFVKNRKEVKLPAGRQVGLSWRLVQQGKVPLYGSSCEISVQIPFEYSVTSSKQIQVKASEQIQGSEKLGYTTSSGPLRIEIAPVGGSGTEGVSTFVKPRSGTEFATVWVRLTNPSQEGSSGVMDINESSLRISSELLGINETFKPVEKCPSGSGATAASPSGSTCLSDEQVLYWSSESGGEPKCEIRRAAPLRIEGGKTRAFKCEVDLSSVEMDGRPLKVGSVRASVQYTYIKKVGSRKVEVKSTG